MVRCRGVGIVVLVTLTFAQGISTSLYKLQVCNYYWIDDWTLLLVSLAMHPDRILYIFFFEQIEFFKKEPDGA